MDETPAVQITAPALSDTIQHSTWHAPDISSITSDSLAQMIRYGKDLIAHTASYFGPKGNIAAITNGMNCQNCHLDAGAKAYGNSFASVASSYPQFRLRSGRIESIEFRVNDCLQRSLNGKTLDSLSKEMRAMVAYIKWLGSDVHKGSKPAGTGMPDITLLTRAADAGKGKTVYDLQCSRCHGAKGEGQLRYDAAEYAYPPLWGPNSYNTGAGLYRLSKLAAYVKDNMPFGIASHDNPQLTIEQAWDVSAYINSQQRPEKKFVHDWPVLADKAFDFPFGPYTDGFSEQQHKYGPYAPIKKAKETEEKIKKQHT